MKTVRKIGRGVSVHGYRHPLLGLLNPYLAPLAALVDPQARRWSPLAAATAAVLMALDKADTLFLRLADARRCMHRDFAGAARTGRTYNGLVRALGRQADTTLPLLKTHLRRKVQSVLDHLPRVGGWRLLAVDGSKEELPRTLSHEAAFGIADNGATPQARISAVVEVPTGLLWDWRIDRADSCEKEHLRQMIGALPAGALLLADGNYVGYPLWTELNRAGRSFLIRVGGNVSLLSRLFPDAALERRGAIVYAWPQSQRGKCPPLRLRLIGLGRGKKKVWLLTNVLEVRRLSRKVAGRAYRLRWGIEVFYRTFKRTVALAKLQSRSAPRGRIELEWALVAGCIAGLLGIEALRKARRDPCRWSPAGVMRALRHTLLHGHAGSPAAGRRHLRRGLSEAQLDAYQRKRPKGSRHRATTRNTPRKHQLQPPRVRPATVSEQDCARHCWPKLAA